MFDILFQGSRINTGYHLLHLNN